MPNFVPIDPSIVDQPDDQSQATAPDPQAPAAGAPPDPNVLATAPEQRTPEQQKALADAALLEHEKAQILLGQKAEQKLAASDPNGDRAPGSRGLSLQEEGALADSQARLSEVQTATDHATAESSVPQRLKGPYQAAKGAASAIEEIGKAVGIHPNDLTTSDIANAPDVGGTGGKIIKSVAQFTTGMVASGAILAPLGLGAGTLVGGAGVAGKVAAGGYGVQSALNAGFSGAFAQDPHEENLANLLEAHAGLAAPIVDFLASKPEDSEATARLKKFAENVGIGAVTEGLITGLKAIRWTRAAKAGQPGAAEEARKVLTEELPQVVQSKGTVGNVRALPGKEAEFAAVNRGLISPADADKLRASVDNTVVQANGGTHFNFEHLPDNYDAKAMINEVSKVVEPAINEVTGGKQSLKDTEDLAGILGTNSQNLIGSIAKDAVGAKQAAARVVAGKSLLVDISQQITEQSRLINAMGVAGTDSTAEEAKLLKLMNVHADLQVNLKGAITGAARTTSAGRIDVKEAAQLFAMADGDAAAVSRLVRPLTLGEKIVGTLQEWRTNCMLSSIKTLAVKGTADVVNAIGLPTAKIVGGALHADLGAMKEGLGTVVGLFKSVGDSFKMARKALNLGHQILATADGVNEVPRTFIGSSNKGFFGNTLNAIGTVVRMPTRLIGTLDEFSKQMNYRAMVYAQASREGAAKGLTKKALAAHIENAATRAFDGAGVATNENALRYAKEATFTSDLDYGVGKWLQDGANRLPVIRTIVPFIKVPTNLIRQAWALTPGIQHLQRQFAEDLAAGGTRAATARGKQVLGAALYAQAVNLATQGRITGSGPTNADARKALLATGWQPYSVKHEDGTYTSYARIDPWGIPFGLAADFAETAGQMNQQTASDTAVALTAALAHNLTSKTYLGGAIDMLDAVSQPKEKGLKVLQSFAGSFIPNTKQFADIRPETADPFMREARTILDGVKKKIPGYSETLAPVRNIYGEAIHVPAGFGPDTLTPFHESTGINDKLLTELTKFPKGFTLPGRTEGTVDLTQLPSKEGGYDAYDRLLQLNGSVKIGGKNLKDRLTSFIESDGYQKLTDDGPGYSGSKYEAIGKLLGQHHTAALQALQAENEGVKAAIRLDKTNRNQALNKGPESVSPIQSIIDQFQQ